MSKEYTAHNPFLQDAEPPAINRMLKLLLRQTVREVRVAIANELNEMLLPETQALLGYKKPKAAAKAKDSFQVIA